MPPMLRAPYPERREDQSPHLYCRRIANRHADSPAWDHSYTPSAVDTEIGGERGHIQCRHRTAHSAVICSYCHFLELYF